MRTVLDVAVTLLVLCSPPAVTRVSAQVRPVADTTAVRPVSVGVVRELDPSLARVLFDRTPRPWRIVVPDTTSPAWRALEAGLYELLRARRTRPGDDTESFLRIDPPAVRGDTLVAYFTIGGRFRCGDTWQGSYTGYEVKAVRYGGSWDAPRTEAVLFGDSVPCVLPPRSPPPGATLLDRVRPAPRR